MKIIPLSEGAFTVDKTKQFIPFDLNKDSLQQNKYERKRFRSFKKNIT